VGIVFRIKEGIKIKVGEVVFAGVFPWPIAN